jgi:hypothetical protein
MWDKKMEVGNARGGRRSPEKAGHKLRSIWIFVPRQKEFAEMITRQAICDIHTHCTAIYTFRTLISLVWWVAGSRNG